MNVGPGQHARASAPRTARRGGWFSVCFEVSVRGLQVVLQAHVPSYGLDLDESATLAHYNQLGSPEENRLAYAYARHLIKTDPAERERLSTLVRDAV
jgi:hypothetical protein